MINFNYSKIIDSNLILYILLSAILWQYIIYLLSLILDIYYNIVYNMYFTHTVYFIYTSMTYR